MKFMTKCFVIGIGVSVGKFGYHVGNYIFAAPIAKMGLKIGEWSKKLNDLKDELEEENK